MSGADKSDPKLFADGAKCGDETKLKFIWVENKVETDKDTYYVQGEIWTGSQAPTRTKWEIDLGTQPTVSNATFSGGDFRQIVTKDSAITEIVLTPSAGYTFKADQLTALNNSLNGTGLSASVVNGVLKISGTPDHDISIERNWPSLTKTGAMIGSTKYENLADAITAATNGQTVEMKKNPYSAVSDATMTNGVTLKDTAGNTYTAKDDSTTVSVATNGKVTLTEGTLDVSANGAVAVKKGQKTYNVSSTSDPKSAFTVTTGSQTTAEATIATAGGQLTNGSGMTFKAGAANSTFPLDGSDLTGAGSNPGDAITVAGGTPTTIKVGEVTTGEEGSIPTNISVVIPSNGKTNTGAVTVTKGNGTDAMGTVTVAKADDSFTVDGNTYTAAADNTTFTIDKNGNVKLTSGGISLGDGKGMNGAVSGVTVWNPEASGNDTVTVVGMPNESEHDKGYDLVTVPAKGTVSIGDKTYANNSDSDPLTLKVFKGGTVGLESGTLYEVVHDGNSLVGFTSGATIANPAESGNDQISVTSDSAKDRVTVPKGAGSKVAITVNGKTTEYTNSAPVHEAGPDAAMKDLVIDVTKDGATLVEGYVALDKNESIGAWGNTITNTSETPFVVEKNSSTDYAAFKLSAGQSFTDKDGNIYFAGENGATFTVDEHGNIGVQQGSADVIPAEDKTPTVKVRESNISDPIYPVSGSSPFTVTVGDAFDDNSDKQKATVTIPDAGDSVTSGNLTFTAGQNCSTFFLDGSKLSNNGDSIAVAGAETNDVTVKVGTTTGEHPTDINVTIPGNQGGTVTKGQPTIVTIGKDNGTFKIDNTSIPINGGAKAGDQYAIAADGSVHKVNAKLFDADNNLINAGDLYSMLGAAQSGQTVEMVAPPETALTNATLKEGVWFEYTTPGENGATNDYKAVNGNAAIDVDTNGMVTLKSGSLYTELGNGNQMVEVAKDSSGNDIYMVSRLSSTDGFTVTAGKGDGSGSDANNAKATVTISGKDEGVYCYPPTNPSTIRFVAGQDNSTFPLDGSYLANDGDSADYSSLSADLSVALGTAANAPTVTLSGTNRGWTNVTKGQPAGFVGSVTLSMSGNSGEGNSFTVNGKTYHFNEVGAEDEATFGIRADGSVALVAGSTKLAATDEEVEVKAEGWRNGVSVSTPAENHNTVSVVAGAPVSAAIVKAGDSVTIGGKTYKAVENTIFNFDENGKVTLSLGKTELSKNDSVLGGAGKLEIKNTAADDAHKVTVESTYDPATKDIVTVPAGGKVTIGGKEYANAGDSDMKLEIDADGNVTLASGKADMGKDAPLNLNGTTITNTKAGSDLTMTKNSETGTLDVKANGSFAVGTGTVKDPSADMSFTINSDGTLTANLPENGSVTINGVKYTGGNGGANLTLDKDGNITSITGTYSATIPGSASYAISGIVKQGDAGVVGATVKLTQGGKEVIRIAPVTTGEGGRYTFPAVPAGTYNVVVEKDSKTMTQLITVGDGDVNLGDLVLPGSNVSSVVDVKPTSPVGAMVGGLDTVASNSAATDPVTITFVVSGADAHNPEIVSLANGKTLMSLDFTVNKEVGDDISQITDTGATVLEVILTFDTTNKTNITVYRQHGAGDGLETIELTKLDARPEAGTYTDGTYYVGNGFVVVYTSKFSPYAIGYNEVTHSGSGSGSSAKKDADYLTCPKDDTCPVAGFTDTDPKAWYHNGVHYCVEKGLMQGHNTGAFAPNDSTTRAQLVMILWRLSGSPAASAGLNFSDVGADAWYTEAIRWAVSENIAQGYGNGTFGPNDTITREQMATILYRYAQSMGYDVSARADISGYADASSVSAYAVPAMQWACGCGMINGKGANTLDPLGSATRAESATMLQRFCTEIVK